MYYKLTPISQPPTKEGRYVVTNGYSFFEVYWDEQCSFHDEDTDCSGLTHYLTPVEELPGGMRWVKLSGRFPEDKRNADGSLKIIIVRKWFPDHYSHINTYTANQIHDFFKTASDNAEREWLDEQPPSHISVTEEQLRSMAKTMEERGWHEEAGAELSGKFQQFVDEYLKQHFGI